MARILLAALAVLFFSCAALTEAEAATDGRKPGKCVRVVPRASGDMLQNGCSSCRLVSVQRTRPGAGKPRSQTLTVPKKSRQPLPFLGPGRTRITADRACPGAAPDPLRAETASVSEQKCVRFIKKKTGAAALINPCKVCRAVKVEFVDIAGNRTHRAFAVAPRSPLSFPAAGLARARILLDAPCR